LPPQLETVQRPLIVGLIASPERIVHLRENRILSLNAASPDLAYVDKAAIASEIAFTRKLCARHSWPIIDVTRRSIEETAAAILALRQTAKERAEIGG
jgi:regulator of PEP synthase PpsR (kinase-PPPase family)